MLPRNVKGFFFKRKRKDPKKRQEKYESKTFMDKSKHMTEVVDLSLKVKRSKRQK